jgi:hypothetical protein
LVAFPELVPPVQVESLWPGLPAVEEVRAQLTRLLAPAGTTGWLTAPTKKRKAPVARAPIRGNQTWVFRLLTADNKQKVNRSLKGSLL